MCERFRNWGLRPSWQLRLNSVLQHTASYFTTWLTAWMVLSFLFHTFHLLPSLALPLFYWASLITAFTALSGCLPMVAITSVRNGRRHSCDPFLLFLLNTEVYHPITDRPALTCDGLGWTWMDSGLCIISFIISFMSVLIFTQRHNVTFGEVLNLLVKMSAWLRHHELLESWTVQTLKYILTPVSSRCLVGVIWKEKARSILQSLTFL